MTTITKMRIMSNPLMFIIGFIIFILYMSGLLYMIKKSHDDQKRKRMKNPNTKSYDQTDYDGGGNWGRFENER